MKFMTITSILVGAATAFSGDMTYYDPSVGTGACGGVYLDSDMIVALSQSRFTASNPNNDPLCHKTITITHGGQSVTATITDSCPSCDADQIDVSPAVFENFAGLDVGVVTVDWNFN